MSSWGLLALAVVSATPPDEAEARRLYRSEPAFEREWPVEFHIRVLEPLTHRIARSFRDLEAQDEHFASAVGWSWGAPGWARPLVMGVNHASWAKEPQAELHSETVVQTLGRWLSAYRFVERSKLKIVTGTVAADGRFHARAHLTVAGQGRDDRWRHDQLELDLQFVRAQDRWHIDHWHLINGETATAERRMFEDVTQLWLTSTPRAVRRRLLERSASNHIYEALRAGRMPAGSRAQPVAMDAHPGVVVVDIDEDGFDDLFVWDVLGPAVLLRNIGGTRFEDATARFGLELDKVSAAAFADLDNDGVIDLVAGHWFSPSVLYRGHRDGDGLRFEAVDITLPSEVVTISIADLNADGAVDVFLGTAAHDHHARLVAANEAGPRPDANVNQLGPRNVLLLSHEGSYTQTAMPIRRNTLQAAFADYDGDGHVDVFMGNDFAPANMLRGLGGGRFDDVSVRSLANQILFGMGASWGDFDGDGDLDLYASAMSSSAGRRIMADRGVFNETLDDDERTARVRAARGSTLLLRTPTGFEDATSVAAFATARQTQWAYGGQFFDADNDGWLDLYVPNGFFTAPGLAPDDVFRDL